MAQAWPDVTVDEGSLRFHIACLRKALGDGTNGARYITNLPGRGYCFAAPISRSTASGGKRGWGAANLPRYQPSPGTPSAHGRPRRCRRRGAPAPSRASRPRPPPRGRAARDRPAPASRPLRPRDAQAIRDVLQGGWRDIHVRTSISAWKLQAPYDPAGSSPMPPPAAEAARLVPPQWRKLIPGRNRQTSACCGSTASRRQAARGASAPPRRNPLRPWSPPYRAAGPRFRPPRTPARCCLCRTLPARRGERARLLHRTGGANRSGSSALQAGCHQTAGFGVPFAHAPRRGWPAAASRCKRWLRPACGSGG
jgi:hypothetical protein